MNESENTTTRDMLIGALIASIVDSIIDIIGAAFGGGIDESDKSNAENKIQSVVDQLNTLGIDQSVAAKLIDSAKQQAVKKMNGKKANAIEKVANEMKNTAAEELSK